MFSSPGEQDMIWRCVHLAGEDHIRDPEWVQEGGSEAQNPGNSLKERAAAFEQEKVAARKQWINKPHAQGPRVSLDD